MTVTDTRLSSYIGGKVTYICSLTGHCMRKLKLVEGHKCRLLIIRPTALSLSFRAQLPRLTQREWWFELFITPDYQASKPFSFIADGRNEGDAAIHGSHRDYESV
jgi:hypothetical protein